MPKLLDHELTEVLAHMPDWHMQNGELVRTLTFPDFMAAIAFINQVAPLAETAGHHPDIDIRFNKIHISLVTHDEGGITEKDISLAKSISALL